MKYKTPAEAALVSLLRQQGVRAIDIALVAQTLEYFQQDIGHLLGMVGFYKRKTLNSPPRTDFDHYFMGIALAVAKRHSCPKREVGAVGTRDNRIITTGYNGTAKGKPECLTHPCPGAAYPAGSNMGLCQARHAEENALDMVEPGDVHTLYVTTQPCESCCRILIHHDIKRVVFLEPYPDEGIENLKLWGIVVETFTPRYYLHL